MIRKLCIINEEWIETEFDSLHLEGWMPQKEFCPSKIRGEKKKRKEERTNKEPVEDVVDQHIRS